MQSMRGGDGDGDGDGDGKSDSDGDGDGDGDGEGEDLRASAGEVASTSRVSHNDRHHRGQANSSNHCIEAVDHVLEVDDHLLDCRVLSGDHHSVARHEVYAASQAHCRDRNKPRGTSKLPVEDL